MQFLAALTGTLQAAMEPVVYTNPDVRWHPGTSTFTASFSDMSARTGLKNDAVKTYIEDQFTKPHVKAALQLQGPVDAAKATLTFVPAKDMAMRALMAYVAANIRTVVSAGFSEGTLQILEEVNRARTRATENATVWSTPVCALACHILMASPVGALFQHYKAIPAGKHNPLVLQCLYYRLILITRQFGATYTSAETESETVTVTETQSVSVPVPASAVPALVPEADPGTASV